MLLQSVGGALLISPFLILVHPFIAQFDLAPQDYA